MGRRCRVTWSPDPSHTRISGVIVDESKQMLYIQTRKGIRMIAKRGTRFEIDGHPVNGDDILYRPEDRIKRVRRRPSVMR